MQGERFLEGRGEGTMRSLRPSAWVMQMRQAKALPIEVGCAGASAPGVLKARTTWISSPEEHGTEVISAK